MWHFIIGFTVTTVTHLIWPLVKLDTTDIKLISVDK